MASAGSVTVDIVVGDARALVVMLPVVAAADDGYCVEA